MKVVVTPNLEVAAEGAEGDGAGAVVVGVGPGVGIGPGVAAEGAGPDAVAAGRLGPM